MLPAERPVDTGANVAGCARREETSTSVYKCQEPVADAVRRVEF